MNVLFTSPGCAKCELAKRILEQAGIEYTVSQDVSEAQRYGIMSVPSLVMSEKVYRFPDIMAMKGGASGV